MMKRILTIAVAAALAACTSATAGPGPAAGSGPAPVTGVSDARPGSAAAAAATITADEMREHVAYLASDALRGRDTPSPGLDSAAAYVAREFARLGLQGGAGEGGFIQRFPLRRNGPAVAPNVVAIFAGSDPTLRGEYVVLSAHMDHVGVGRPVRGDSIYNGADDDASGTSALLEVAEAFAALETRPARSILFLGVSGEEKGLLGSAWFSDHPTVPIGSIVANVNIDMIGRNTPDDVVVIGKNYSSLGPLVERMAAENRQIVGLTPADDRWPGRALLLPQRPLQLRAEGNPGHLLLRRPARGLPPALGRGGAAGRGQGRPRGAPGFFRQPRRRHHPGASAVDPRRTARGAADGWPGLSRRGRHARRPATGFAGWRAFPRSGNPRGRYWIRSPSPKVA